MKLTHIHARNIAGFEDFDLTPGDVNVVSGRNKTGKSSLLDVILCGLGAGDDEELLRVGCADGEIVLKLEDDRETWEIRRALTAAGGAGKTRIRSSRTGNVGAVKAFLALIADAVSMDPLRRALRASPKEQTEILLKTLPLELDPAELREAVPDFPWEIQGDALSTVERIGKQIYDYRTGVNRVKEDQERTIRELEATLPQNHEDSGSHMLIAKLRARTHELRLEIARLEKANAANLNAQKERLRADSERRRLNAERSAETQIEAIRKRLTAEINTLAEGLMDDVAAATSSSAEILAEETAKLYEEEKSNTAEISRLEEVLKGESRASAQREIIRRTKAKAKEGEEESARLSTALKNLAALKVRLLERIPIKGLEFKDGKPWLDGVPLHRANTAEQIKFWARIAAMRAGPLGIVCFDDAEHLDDENFPLLVNAAKDWCKKKPGLQFFITRVAPSDFKVEVI